MNFLAHCLIAARANPGNETMAAGLIAGAILGDFVKGPVPERWPAPLQAGIRLHRRIDAFSNGSGGVRRSCNRFPADLRRLAPVFVDIVADHCLATDWPAFHDEPLETFSRRCYTTLEPHAHRLDSPGRRYLDWLVKEDLMARYRSGAAMERGLLSVTRRLDREHLNDALLEFVAGYLPDLHDDFRGYFPELLAHGREWTADMLDITNIIRGELLAHGREWTARLAARSAAAGGPG